MEDYKAMYEEERARADGLSTKVSKLEQDLVSTKKVISCFSHDARSSLAVASSQVELVHMLLEPTDKADVFNLTSEVVSYLPLLEKRIKRVANMYQQYLDMERMERREYILQPQRINLLHIINEAREEVDEGVVKKLKKPVKIVYNMVESHVAEDFALFNGEEDKIRSCLSNLIQNAYEAALDNTEVHIYLNSDRDNLSIEITNKGAIPKELRDPEKLFAYGATSGKKKGNGIGTHTARLFARAHGGEITFQTSDKTNSTLFKIELPKSVDED